MRQRRTPLSKQSNRDRGLAALELVYVVPLLVAFIIAIVQFSLFFSRSIDVNSAARDAARTLALRGTPTYPAGMSGSNVTVCAPNDNRGNSQVTVTATYTFSIPFLSLGSRTISSTARMRCGG